jgi:putative ABC transport system permease protein
VSSPIAIRIARRELRAGLSGFRVFLACLALGVAAIAAVGTVRSSIGAGLAAEGAAMLGGDAEVGLTYRFANPEERAFLDAISDRVSETVDFRSLAGVALPDGTSDRALTQVRAVDNAYPLIGAVTLSPDIPLAEALAGTRDLPGAVMEPALADRLGLIPGDTFSLGLQEFTLSALLTRYPDN